MIYLKCLSGTQSAVTLWSGCWRTKQAPKLTNILKMRVYNDRDCPHWHVLDCCREQQRAEHESRESNWAVFKFMTRLMHSERRPRSLSHCQCVFGFFFPWNFILIALISAVKGDRTHTHSLCFHIIISFHINILLTECFLQPLTLNLTIT